MNFELNRLGKIALLASLTDQEEEKTMKEELSNNRNGYKLAVTFVSGMTSDIKRSFVKSIIGCSLQNDLIRKTPGQIHAVVHAALDALSGVIHQVPSDASLKLKVSITTDSNWVAVAIYGESAFYPLTNHERSSLAAMHLGG